MPAGERREQDLIEKIRRLPEDKLAEVEDFVDFLRQRQEERRLAQAMTGASEAAFAKVWDNPEDAEYDRLCVRRHTRPVL
jgi:hypothetical protein